MFDWPQFLSTRGIEFIETGPSTSRGNIYIKCVFCGPQEHGHHLGISLHGKGYGCWKNTQHRGKNEAKLVAALTGMMYEDARLLVERGAGVVGSSGLSAMVEGILGMGNHAAQKRVLTLPPEFKFMGKDTPEIFVRYMRERGFDNAGIIRLAYEYRIHYAMTGEWSYRVIFPILTQNSHLVTWTARAVSSAAKIRYKTLTTDPEKAGTGQLALAPITDCLLGCPNLYEGGTLLVVCEGPFDALRVSMLAREYGGAATCLFGKTISQEQLGMLTELRSHFRGIYLLLDKESSLDGVGVVARMSAAGIVNVALPEGKDPGDAPENVLRGLLYGLRDDANSVRRIRSVM